MKENADWEIEEGTHITYATSMSEFNFFFIDIWFKIEFETALSKVLYHLVGRDLKDEDLNFKNLMRVYKYFCEFQVYYTGS